MDSRCKFLVITKDEKNESITKWSCYNQYESRNLIQQCLLKKGYCRYPIGPFLPENEPVES